MLQINLKIDQPINVTPLEIPRTVALLRIPNSKDFATVSEVIQQLNELKLEDDLPMAQRPLVELRIRLEKPEPSIRQQIEEAIAQLPVRLLKISTAYTGAEHTLADITVEERLEELQPHDVFERCYFSKYNCDPSDELKGLFSQLLQTVQEHD